MKCENALLIESITELIGTLYCKYVSLIERFLEEMDFVLPVKILFSYVLLEFIRGSILLRDTGDFLFKTILFHNYMTTEVSALLNSQEEPAFCF